jgi:hypothetical protein
MLGALRAHPTRPQPGLRSGRICSNAVTGTERSGHIAVRWKLTTTISTPRMGSAWYWLCGVASRRQNSSFAA